jgi:hypothetical protein
MSATDSTSTVAEYAGPGLATRDRGLSICGFQVHGADAEGATVLRKQLELAPDRFKDFWRD